MKKWLQRIPIILIYPILRVWDDLDNEDHTLAWKQCKEIWDDCPMKWL